MQIIDDGVKERNIHTYIMEEKGFDYTIQSIRMGYMTQIEDGAMHFFPVWYFQCKLGEKRYYITGSGCKKWCCYLYGIKKDIINDEKNNVKRSILNIRMLFVIVANFIILFVKSI